MKVYISGPITGVSDFEKNFPFFTPKPYKHTASEGKREITPNDCRILHLMRMLHFRRLKKPALLCTWTQCI